MDMGYQSIIIGSCKPYICRQLRTDGGFLFYASIIIVNFDKVKF